MSAEEHLAELFSAADGDIVGRIRLQKIAYLLQQKAGCRDLSFVYHHYGPFCRDLADALDFGVVFSDRIEEEIRETGRGTTYSAFRWKGLEPPAKSETLLGLPAADAQQEVARLKKEPSVILELAATIHWLRHAEKAPDWKATLKARKTIKATDQNIARAEQVLADLGLAA
ncbi:MAG: hypothetical protein GVY13_06365 [Alphaproteobacteria bacterium]|jgi:uncharacterized protein YwgA|nr:hypothetical protein [Alphaproteobacteria bacterium]